MINRLRHLWANHRALLLVFFGVVAVLAFFGVRTVGAALYWHDPAHRNQAIEGWMTPRYVSLSYHLPPEILGPALFLTKDNPIRFETLQTIAAANDVTLQDLQTRIDAATTAFRANQP